MMSNILSIIISDVFLFKLASSDNYDYVTCCYLHTPVAHHTDHGLSQYDNIQAYCDPNTASSVFLIIIHVL